MNFSRCERSTLSSFKDYLASLSSPIDSFVEQHLVESDYYRITADGAELGFFAISNDTLLTQFYLNDTGLQRGRELFAEVLEQHKPSTAFIPTCDELFLSHALDKHTALKKMAFQFSDGGKPIDYTPKQPKPAYRLAEAADIPALNAIEDSIIDNPEERISRGELHVGYLDDKLVAIGLMEASLFWSDRTSIGMLTHESCRQQGIGTQTLLYLKQLCYDKNIMPIAGCGYSNIGSQKTLQAAGMITKTRLLKLSF